MQNSIQKSRGIKSADTRSNPWRRMPERGKEFLPETPGRCSLHCKKSQQLKTLQSSKITALQLKRIVCQQARCGSINIFEQRLSRASWASRPDIWHSWCKPAGSSGTRVPGSLALHRLPHSSLTCTPFPSFQVQIFSFWLPFSAFLSPSVDYLALFM